MKLSFVLAVFLSLASATGNTAAAGVFKKTGDGLIHQPSGVAFPARIGSFESVERPHTYDRKGHDVSMRYELPRQIVADVYAYPVTQTTGGLDSEFHRQENAIKQLNRNVRLVSRENALIVQSGHRVTGKHATYDLERSFQGSTYVKAGSQMYIFRDGIVVRRLPLLLPT